MADSKNNEAVDEKEDGKGSDLPEVEEKSVSKSDTGKFGKTKISYTATAATQVIDRDDDKKAVFFYVAYTQDDVDPADRPIVFAFNGGPGSSTVWLHLGLFGPKRVEFDKDGFPVGIPGRLIHNEHSILDVADVVHVDAIGTGLSRGLPKDKEKEYHHFGKDIESFSDFIVSYLNRNGRWASPSYLAGESYGTTRGAAIAADLFNRHGLQLNGVMLISVAMSFQTIGMDVGAGFMFHRGNDLPFLTHFPTYAATAWYHQRLAKKHQSKSLRSFLDEVEEFAMGEYWSALAKGDRLDEKSRTRIVKKVAEYTGLSEEYVDYYDLRIHIMRFCKELLRSERKTVGRLDSRYTGTDRVPLGDNIESDPAANLTTGPMTSALNHYVRSELGFETDDFYNILSMEINQRWDYEEFKNHYVETSEKLREAMSRTQSMKVFVANGYFDLATPHLAAEYTFSHMGLEPDVRNNVRMEYYEAGHMMYVHEPSLKKLAADLREFVSESH
jgi:carboxypeptidase C (cathepsin A)